MVTNNQEQEVLGIVLISRLASLVVSFSAIILSTFLNVIVLLRCPFKQQT